MSCFHNLGHLLELGSSALITPLLCQIEFAEGQKSRALCHNNSEVCPVHMAQVKICDCSSASEMLF